MYMGLMQSVVVGRVRKTTPSLQKKTFPGCKSTWQQRRPSDIHGHGEEAKRSEN